MTRILIIEDDECKSFHTDRAARRSVDAGGMAERR